MAMHVEIPDDLAKLVSERAAQTGADPEQVVIGAIRKSLLGDLRLAETLGPVRQAFAQSGMSEDELGDLLEEEKHAMREGK